jgi:hypothetical protein
MVRRQPLARLLAAAAAVALAGCTTTEAARPPGLVELLERPAERALHESLRAYDDGHYPQAEAAAGRALQLGLGHARDRATAHKLRAFVACAGERVNDCEAEFRAARQADPAFTLSRSEAGHPLWGPVYRRTLPQGR